MDIRTLLLPNADRPISLAQELGQIFVKLPYTCQIYLFGSLASGRSDRWSDIDLLVITQDIPVYEELLRELDHAMPIWHHAPPRPSTDHPGGHVIATVFEHESIFHNLDLNFMSLADSQRPDAYRWFGSLHLLWRTDNMASGSRAGEGRSSKEIIPWPVIPLPEQELNAAMFWAKRAMRKWLRLAQDQAELAITAQHLAQLLAQEPAAREMQDSRIYTLAKTYVQVAEYLLTNGAPV